MYALFYNKNVNHLNNSLAVSAKAKWLLCFLLFIPAVQAEGFDREHRQDFLLGLFLSERIEATNKVLKDHPEMERVMKIAARLIDAAGTGHLYTFQIIEAPVANAFALPGGFVFITDKLLDLKLNDDELAFLVGHEISHVQNKHFARIQKESVKVSLLNVLATIGTILLAHHQNSEDYDRIRRQQGSVYRHKPPELTRPSATQLPPFFVPILAGNLFGTLYMMHSHREFELESDYTGAKMAMAAGYSLEKGIGMLEKLFYANYRNSAYEVWQTHPLTKIRIESLRGKLGSYKGQKKKGDAYLEEFRKVYAKRILGFYKQLVHWHVKGLLKKTEFKAAESRKILLDRAYRLSADPMIQREAVRFELENHLKKEIEESPFLVADYGLMKQKLMQLKKLGGELSKATEKEILSRREQSLMEHKKSMAELTAGYKQLEFMVKNFPEESEAESWKLQKWLKEPDMDIKTKEANEFLENKNKSKEVEKELHEMLLRVKKHPLYYRRITRLLKTTPSSEDMQEVISKCEELEEIARYQHEFPDDQFMNMALEKKAELTEHQFKLGRLSSVSEDYTKAVEAFHQILLYDSGSELEDAARQQIYKLNTLERKAKF